MILVWELENDLHQAGAGIVLDRLELGAKIAASGQREASDQSSTSKNWSHFVMSLILYTHSLSLLYSSD